MDKINFVVVVDRFDYNSGLNNCMHNLAHKLHLLGQNVFTFGTGKPGFQYKTLCVSNWDNSRSNFVYDWNESTRILNKLDKNKTIFILTPTMTNQCQEFQNYGTICKWVLRPGDLIEEDNSSIIVYMNEASNTANTRCDLIMMANVFDLHFWNEGNLKRNKNCYLTKRLNIQDNDDYIKENIQKVANLSRFKKFFHLDTISPFAGIWDFDQKTKYMIKPILQQSEYFLSFEKYTYWNTFAALCGCKVIALDKNNEFSKKVEELPEFNKGIAFSFDNLNHAINTRHLLREQLKNIEIDQIQQIKDFIKLCYKKLDINN